MTELRNVHPVAICVNFDPDEVRRRFKVDAHYCPYPGVEKYNGITQWGGWLNVQMDLNPDDTYIVVDGDAVFQRDFLQSEIDRFNSYDHNTLGIGYNASPDDTLLNEAGRLGTDLTDVNETMKEWYGSLDRKVYNTGFMAAKPAVYKAMKTFIEGEWDRFSPCFKHYAKIQYLICVALFNLGVKIDELDYSIHTHGHFGIPSACTWDGKSLQHNGIPVLFRHNIF